MTHIWMKDGQRLKEAIKTERRQAAITKAALAGTVRALDAPSDSGIDLSAIEWPTVPHYGFAHGKHTMELALHIVERHSMEPTFVPYFEGITPDDRRVLKAAALMHDLGRTRPWNVDDPYHAKRSAEMADEAMKKTRWWTEAHLRERVCRLILEHSLDPKEKPRDPLLMALHDAECFEAARFQREGQDGMMRMVKRRVQCLTSWALIEAHHERWRDRYR